MLIKKLKTMFGVCLDDQEENPSLIIPSNIDPASYLKIPGTNSCIVKIEEDWTKKDNYETSHRKVLEKGLQVPTPALFTIHLKNVINAYHNNGDVYQADGNKILREELENIYKHLTTNHINGGTWTWLNARFVSGSGFNNMDLETITGIDSNKNLIAKREKLEECLMEDCYVDLEFNKQGLVVKKSDQQEDIKGKNIYFSHPSKNSVARFVSGSSWSGLNCGWYPYSSVGSLGVYTSYELV